MPVLKAAQAQPQCEKALAREDDVETMPHAATVSVSPVRALTPGSERAAGLGLADREENIEAPNLPHAVELTRHAARFARQSSP
jgi:hypothetical protein